MKKKENKKRYFAISYFADSTRVGEIVLNCDSFPSNKLIIATVKKECYEKYNIDLSKIIIIAIFEFKSKADYDNYVKE